MERSKRTGAPLSVAVVDLDGFKEVNDREGHDVGDHVLQRFAATTRAVVRGGGDVARLGGDGFGLLAPGSGEAGIGLLADRLAEATSEGVAYR